MITSKDLNLLLARAESGTRKNTKAELTWFQRMKDEAAKMQKAEEAEKCWLRRCDQLVVARLNLKGHQLHLCREHRDELIQKADEVHSYINAASPDGYSDWPWELPTA